MVLRGALGERGLLDEVSAALASSTRRILEVAEPTAWFDEGHAVAVYECVVRSRGAEVCREIGRDAARIAMTSSWRDFMGVLEGYLGGTPRMAFDQLPVLWNATRRDAGDLRCVESSMRHAVTEIRGFAYAESAAWREVWAGHHEALLRHLRFTGQVAIESVVPATGLVRVRTSWTLGETERPA